MRYSTLAFGLVAILFSVVSMAQTVEYSRKLSGTLDVDANGQVRTYDLQSAGLPYIDQSLGNLVESWQFVPSVILGKSQPVKVEFIVTVLRKNLEDPTYTIKRVEFSPTNAKVSVRGATSSEELAYCADTSAVPRKDIICPIVLPNDPLISDQGVSAEVYVAIKKTDAVPSVALDSVYLYGSSNSKLSSKALPTAKAKYAEAALAFASKNSISLLQDKEQVMTRVEFVQSNNKSNWRRQEKAETANTDWLNDAFRAKTMYSSQGGLELK